MVKPPTVVFFDIDGTLIDTAGAGRAAMLRALSRLSPGASPGEAVDFAGRTDRAIAHDLLRTAGISPDPDTVEVFFQFYCEALPETLAERPEGRVLPHVPEVLESLRNRPDTVLALLTGNIRRGAYTKLAHFGLARYFPCGGFGDRFVDRRMVARDALEAVRRFLSCEPDPQRCFVIGDTVHDLRCARAIGAVPVAVLTGWAQANELAKEKPHAVLETLAELEQLLPPPKP